MSSEGYVHGYSAREASRLTDQATTLAQLLHGDTQYPPGSRVLEAGCGVGSQTVILAQGSPEAEFVCVDVSEESVRRAGERAAELGIGNVTFQVGDLFHLDFPENSFDHVFVCFVLEHLPNPEAALTALRGVLKPGGTMTVVEGDHGSFYCHPETQEAKQAVDCLIRSQASMGGDSLIGRRLYPLLRSVGFTQVQVSPRMVYVDASKPELVEGFSKRTFTAMVEGVRGKALAEGMMTESAWDKGIRDMYRATEDDGTFCYTFFKATGWKEK